MCCRLAARCWLPLALVSLAASWALLASSSAQTPRGKKYALVVGVRSYDSFKLRKLDYTENDAEDLARELSKRAGFSVRVLTTTRGEKDTSDLPTAAHLRKEIKALLARKKRDDTVLVALAGHGIQGSVKEGGKEKDESFFCPSDAQFNDNDTLISLSKLFSDLSDCGAGVKLLLVDACRNDPKLGRNADPDNLPRPPRGTAALFSCKGGERAFETNKLGDRGHGVFFHYVLEGLRGKARNEDNEVTWDRLTEFVKRQVSRQVPVVIGGGAKQTPHELRNLEGESPVLVAPLSGTVAKEEKPAKVRGADNPKLTPPSTVCIDGGMHEGGISGLPNLLVTKKKGTEGWQKVTRGAAVSTNEPLVALPGYTALIKGLRGKDFTLLLRGHVREFSVHPIQDYLMESAVVLHKNDDFDLDLTLKRGRIYVRNQRTKGSLKVRMRFETEVWDMNLQGPGTEVGVDLVKRYTSEINWRAGEEPRTELALTLLGGEMVLKVDRLGSDTMEAEAPKVAVIFWDSFTKAGEPKSISDPKKLDVIRRLWAKTPPALDNLASAQRNAVKQISTAMKNLEVLMTRKRVAADIALVETLGKEELFSRVLAVYSLGAIDEINRLIDVLGDEGPDHALDRTTAVHTLRRWLSRGPEQSKLLFNKDSKTGATTGLLLAKRYRPREAESIRDLLFDFPLADCSKPETFDVLAQCLQRKVAIAELAYYHLRALSRGAKLPPGFNAADPLDLREAYARRIEEMIAKKQLPPSTSAQKEEK
jgi:uncharacterized caspase-like protein